MKQSGLYFALTIYEYSHALLLSFILQDETSWGMPCVVGTHPYAHPGLYFIQTMQVMNNIQSPISIDYHDDAWLDCLQQIETAEIAAPV